tara:strand:- start:1416 stop:1757 length:342 start_codon:yes stop_codon:yes gene_type:complete
MNNKYNLPDEAVEAFHDVIKDIKRKRKKVTFIKNVRDRQRLEAGWNFQTKWSKKTIQKAADFITSLEADDALTFWQSIGTGPNANHNVAKLHIAFSSDGVLVKDHLINILTKD